MADEKRRPFESPEDLGETGAGKGGERVSQPGSATPRERDQMPRGHRRTVSGAESPGPNNEVDRVQDTYAREQAPDPEDVVSDEELRKAIEGLPPVRHERRKAA